MARYDLSIECKGVADITPRSNYVLDIDLEEVDIGFISELSGEDIVSNCNDTKELLEAIDDVDIFAYLEESGVIYNKA